MLVPVRLVALISDEVVLDAVEVLDADVDERVIVDSVFVLEDLVLVE